MTCIHVPHVYVYRIPKIPVFTHLTHTGPTFRAENSNTRRHLAEFWMIEPEMAFCDIHDDMQCAEDYVKFCCSHVLQHCRYSRCVACCSFFLCQMLFIIILCFDPQAPSLPNARHRPDLEFIAQRIDKSCIERLENVASSSFTRVPYTEAIRLLEEAIASKKVKFENPVCVCMMGEWGACHVLLEHMLSCCQAVVVLNKIVFWGGEHGIFGTTVQCHSLHTVHCRSSRCRGALTWPVSMKSFWLGSISRAPSSCMTTPRRSRRFTCASTTTTRR